MKETLVYQGKQTAALYPHGSQSDGFKEKIQWYNVISPYEVIYVDQVKDLKENFPYKIDNQVLLSKKELNRLNQGELVEKEGYVEEFKRNIVGAIFPLMKDDRLTGFVYIYVPLAEMSEVFQTGIPILVIVGVIFFLVIFLILNSLLNSLFLPMKEVQSFSKEVAKGDFSKRVTVRKNDEIGELATMFNKMVDSLEKQDIEKKEFLSNVAHEIRTPLTYITGYAQAILDGVYTSKDEKDKKLALVIKESNRMKLLVQDLLDLTRIQDKSFVFEKQLLPLSQLIIETLDLLTYPLEQKSILPVKNLNDEIIIEGDQNRLQQVLINVLDNAIKYSHENSEIVIETFEDQSNAFITIEDHGIGIPQEKLKRIGERFYRTDLSRSRGTGGFGLGMSITNEIVRKHGGSIVIQSDIGEGCKVMIQLPSI
ncbi:HAMP domain-containing histidine kinase [Rossellomorea sp. BNER]|nr:HAMP domain-containing histidine kinase [Rossellomorea sp. BNER]